MFKIALKSIKGKFKDSIKLFIIITLSFLLVTSSLLSFTSIENSRKQQKINLYGTFENVYMNKDKSFGDELKRSVNISKISESKIISQAKQFGSIQSVNKDVIDDLKLKIKDGRFPQKTDELAIDISQTPYFTKTPKLNEDVYLEIENVIFDNLANDKSLDVEIKSYTIPENLLKRLKGIIPEAFRVFLSKKLNIDAHGSEMEKYIDEHIGEIFNINILNKTTSREALSNDSYFIFVESTKAPLAFSNGIATFLIKNFFKDNNSSKNQIPNIEEFEKETGLKFLDDSFNEIEEINKESEQQLVELRKSIIVYRPVKLVGLFSSFSGIHNLNSNFEPTSFVNEETADNILKSLETAYKYIGQELPKNYNYYIKTKDGSESYFNKNNQDISLYRNSLSYPSKDSDSSQSISVALLSFIFILTTLSIFQIFMIQFKKRIRSLALFKSIGATNKQVKKLLFYELVILTGIALPLGVISGFLTSLLIIKGYGLKYGINVPLIINKELLLIGILLSIISCMSAMLYPLFKLKTISLTGSVDTVNKKSQNIERIKAIKNTKKFKNITVSSIFKRHSYFNRRGNLISISVYTVILSSLILSLLSSFLAFNQYNENVTEKNKPDFMLKENVISSSLNIKSAMDSLKKVKGVNNVDLFQFRDGAFISNSSYKETALFTLLKNGSSEGISAKLFNRIKLSNDINKDPTVSEANEGSKVTIIGLAKDSNYVNILLSSSENPNFNKEDFDKGEAVFILYPRYKIKNNDISIKEDVNQIKSSSNSKIRKAILSGFAEYSYLNKDAILLEKNDDMKMESISISRLDNRVGNEKIDLSPKTVKASVISVINTLKSGIWPVMEDNDFPVIIGSKAYLEKNIYSNPFKNIKDVSKEFNNDTYGRSEIAIYTKNIDENSILEIRKAATDYNMEFVDLTTETKTLYNSALKIAIASMLFALTLTIIAFEIQINSQKSYLNEERSFIGILQSIGVSNKNLKTAYLKKATQFALVSVILSHLLFIAAIILSAVLKSGLKNVFSKNFMKYMFITMYNYPWWIHILIVLLFLVFILLMSYRPLKKISDTAPVSNIRSL